MLNDSFGIESGLMTTLTEAIGNQVKVLGWYDNEWGFANRLVEFAERITAAASLP